MRRSVEDAAASDLIPIPICCPTCGMTSLVCFPSIVVARALTSWNNMRLYTSCHDASWDASQPEMQVIRDYVGDEWLKLQNLERA